MERMSLGSKIPEHVAAVETTEAGTRYHCFLRIAQRTAWLDKDREHRSSISCFHPKVLQAWEAFAVVLHADPRAQGRLWHKP